MIRIHSFEHVEFEDTSEIGVWAAARGFKLSRTRFYAGDKAPGPEKYDWLVIMGGPMNIYEHAKYPWLADEKKSIREAVDAGKTVLGVCLGGQLISDVLGGKVTKNKFREIGWHELKFTPAAKTSPVFGGFPEALTVFHWHGDTFSIPPGAVRIASSEGCENQAFIFGDRVIGLQFHLEYSAGAIESMLEECRGELVSDSPYVQSAAKIRAGLANVQTLTSYLGRALDALSSLKTNPAADIRPVMR